MKLPSGTEEAALAGLPPDGAAAWPCLGLEWLGKCTYNPLNPPGPYLSVGEALGAIALLLAFSQFFRPRTKLRLAVAPARTRGAIALLALGLACSFVAAVAPALTANPIPVLGYPVFWELFGGLCIVAAVSLVALLFLPSRHPAFTQRNSTAFMSKVIETVRRGLEEELPDMLDDIAGCFKDIVLAAGLFDQEEREVYQNRDALTQRQTHIQNAGTILEALSDTRTCQVLVLRCPDVAARMVLTLKECGRRREHNPLLREILRQAMVNPNSLLHRETEFYGLGRFQGWFRLTFGDLSFVEDCRPLQVLRYEDRENIEAIKLLRKALEAATDAALAETDRRLPALASGFNQLLEFAGWNCAFGKTEQGGRAHQTIGYMSTTEAARAVAHLCDGLEDVPPPPLVLGAVPDNYSPHTTCTLWDIAANGIFEVLLLAAQIPDDDSTFPLAMDVWECVSPVNENGPSESTQCIQRRLRHLLDRKVAENLGRGYYPMIVRPLILVVHLRNGRTGKRFYEEELYAAVREALPRLAVEDQERLSEILPAHATYDANRRLVHFAARNRFREAHDFMLDQPW